MKLKAEKMETVVTIDPPENATENATGREARLLSKRRSTRVAIDFPVSVIGLDAVGKIFAENTRTIAVNAHGALVSLKTQIDLQKPVFLSNTKISLEVQCRVIYQKPTKKDNFEVGLEFESQYPRFWGMNFPPEDWDPAERKQPSMARRPFPSPKKGSNG